MLFAVANDDWKPGSALAASETRLGLYRTREEAQALAEGRRLLAVSVRHDSLRGVVTSTLPTSPGAWSAPAIVGESGGVTTLASIPSKFVQVVGPPRFRAHAGHQASGFPHLYRHQEEMATAPGRDARPWLASLNRPSWPRGSR